MAALEKVKYRTFVMCELYFFQTPLSELKKKYIFYTFLFI